MTAREVVGTVPVATADEVEAVAARLRAAQPAWRSTGARGARGWLAKWRDWMLYHSDELLAYGKMFCVRGHAVAGSSMHRQNT